MQKLTTHKREQSDAEYSYLKDMFNVSSQQVAGAIRVAGKNIKAIENYLRRKTVSTRID